ncbi:MAG TPA: NTP transferase domain-containing protein [Holophagaceae bacterium]|nr:NTP transferase domain-containing protein [Holophagaceae bacterium]
MASELDGFLLAAGLGTRMGPLSRVLPKPAWPLRGRSLLQWSADGLRNAGFTHLACNVHLHPERLAEAAEGLECCPEPTLLGSAGGLHHARGRVREALAVWNADALGEVPWARLRAEHLNRGAQLTWLLVPHPGGPWNPVFTDLDSRILPLGTPAGPRGPFHFTGASVWSPEALDLLPEGRSEVRDLLPLLRDHRALVVEPFPWREVGTPDQLIAAAAALAPGAEGRLPGCYVHPTARPAGRLRRCILGPEAAPHAAFEDEDALWYGEGDRQVRLALG